MFSRRIWTMAGAALVAVVAGTMLQAGPVSAATTTTVTKTLTTGHVATMTKVAQAAAAEPVCTDLTAYGYDLGGAFLCNYTIDEWDFSNGVAQFFVIATNYSVYTRWIQANGTLSGWVNLGGQVKRPTGTIGSSDPAYESPWMTGSGNTPSIVVFGNSSSYVDYARTRSASGTWNAWHIV